MRNIRASGEVEALIGAENLRELEGDAFLWYVCPVCNKRGSTENPTSVVVDLYPDIAVVELAHADCTHSKIVRVDAGVPPGIGLDGGGADLRARARVLSYPGEPTPRPLFLLEIRVVTAVTTQGGERINLVVNAFLERGLALMHTGDQMPHPAAGWQLQRPGRDTVLLLGPSDEVIYEGVCPQSGDWIDLVEAAGACVVLVGTIGLYAFSDEELDVDRLRRMLNDAARAGALTGGLVSCPSDLPGASQALTAGRPQDGPDPAERPDGEALTSTHRGRRLPRALITGRATAQAIASSTPTAAAVSAAGNLAAVAA
jgi:hypothetical protein